MPTLELKTRQFRQIRQWSPLETQTLHTIYRTPCCLKKIKHLIQRFSSFVYINLCMSIAHTLDNDILLGLFLNCIPPILKKKIQILKLGQFIQSP